MTDRFDDLLIKARAEMLGKHKLRAEPSKDAVFEYVWDGIQKGWMRDLGQGAKNLGEGAKAGWQKKRPSNEGHNQRVQNIGSRASQRAAERSARQSEYGRNYRARKKAEAMANARQESERGQARANTLQGMRDDGITPPGQGGTNWPTVEGPTGPPPSATEAGFAAMENTGAQTPPSLDDSFSTLGVSEHTPAPSRHDTPASFSDLSQGRMPSTAPQPTPTEEALGRNPANNLDTSPEALEQAGSVLDAGVQTPPSAAAEAGFAAMERPEIQDANAVLGGEVSYNQQGQRIPEQPAPKPMPGTGQEKETGRVAPQREKLPATPASRRVQEATQGSGIGEEIPGAMDKVKQNRVRHKVDNMPTPPKTAVEAGMKELEPTPEAEAPPAEESRVGLPWKPTLTESGMGSRDEDWNYRSRKPWGARSAKGKAAAEYYASLEAPPEAEAEAEAPAPEAEAPAPNAPTDVESATKRAQERKAKRESIPQSQQTLFDAPKAEAPAPSGEAVPYGEYTKHIQAASQGSEQSLNWLASNPASVAQHSSGGLPKRIQDALDAKGGSSKTEPKLEDLPGNPDVKPKKGKKAKEDKKKSHDAFNSAWSVLKDPFANPFDNPSAFAIHDNFNMNKARRLPSETEMNSIRGVGEALSVSPDPPTMNAGMPRMKDMDAYYAEQQAARDETDRYFKNQEKLSAMGMDEIQARLAANPEHEGDWRHLSQEGLDRASMAEIAQLMADIDHESMHRATTLVADPPYMSNDDEKLASADLSLLPAGMLKQLKGQRQADADYSLLPSGWQEGVVE